VKENTNIEELFKSKFDGFQPEVDPSVWANIQAGIGTGAVVGTGIATGIKIALISGGIIAASAVVWYASTTNNSNESTDNLNTNTIVVDNNTTNDDKNTEPIIIVNDWNDPVIKEHQKEIEKELLNNQKNQYTTKTDNETAVTKTTDQSTANTDNGVVSKQNETNNVVDNQTVDNAEKTIDKTKPEMPTGRMEFNQQQVYAPSTVSFIANAKNYKEIKWDFGDGTTASGNEVKHTYNKPGKYTVNMRVIGQENTYEERQEITVKTKSSIDNVPNVITPNGDRINDYFSVKSTNIQTFFISITDNRGNEIFSSNDIDFVWDGTDFNGNLVEKGMYTYIIIAEGKDGSVFKLPGQIYVQ